MKVVEIDNLSKTYKSGKKALDNVSFSLEQGEVFGFLGPNGAGKTTTVKLLSGMLSPTEGNCRIYDIDPFAHPEKVHALSGVITEHAQMYDNMTGMQNLIFYGAVFGMSSDERNKRAQILLDKLDLTDAKDRKLATYSTGMRQRLSIARAMIHRPKILFLDEPTSGLDPESTQSVNSMIKGLARDEGTTIFLCTHQLRYAQEICSSYGLLDEGRLLAAGDIGRLRAMVFSGMTVTIRADHFPPNMASRKIEGQCCEIDVQSEHDIPLLVKRIVEDGGNIYHISSRKLSLEEIYFALIEKSGINREGE